MRCSSNNFLVFLLIQHIYLESEFAKSVPFHSLHWPQTSEDIIENPNVLIMMNDNSALPWGPEDEKTPAGIETVIAAQAVRPAPDKILEEIIVKREPGGVQRIVLGHIKHGETLDQNVVEVKEEPID